MHRIFAVLLAGLALGQQPFDPNFLSNHVDGRALREMLPRYLKAKAFKMIDDRRATVTKISSAQDVFARRQSFRERYTRALGGPFGEKTPLNARTVATLDFDGYKVEKVLFESHPGFTVTANLYLPKSGAAPYPAILFPLGHEAGAKAHEAWQYVLVSMAKKGYVALAWDTIGQGERIQLWDQDTRESKVIRSTTEHTITGLQTLLVGDPLARYTIWDGIRALDYLASRPEVDTAKIGLTGNSGGGTHTAYIGSLDDRIAAAAPSCYLTNWKRLLETIGPQDAEQCVPGFLSEGLDHPDFVLAFAPKPYMMLTAIRDFFSIDGARETYSEVARVYDSIGRGDRFSKFEADDGHGYTKPRRLAAYQFFAKWLKGVDDTSGEPEVTILNEEELWATKSGQVATALGGETVHSLNLKRLAGFPRRAPSLDAVRRLLSYAPAQGPAPVKSYGTAAASGYRIEKLTYEPETGITLPALLYLPERTGKLPAVLVAHGQGKAGARVVSEQLAAAGNVVLAVDLRGLGETRIAGDRNGSDWPRYFGDYESTMTAMLTGKTLLAMRTEDVTRAMDVLAARAEVDPARITGYGLESAAVPLLHAAAFDTRFSRIALERMVLSWESVVRGRIHRNQWESAVPGALRVYDLPDLVASVASRGVKLIDATNELGQVVPVAEVAAVYPNTPVVRRKLDATAPGLLAQ